LIVSGVIRNQLSGIAMLVRLGFVIDWFFELVGLLGASARV
jgi:hypothetical protein